MFDEFEDEYEFEENIEYVTFHCKCGNQITVAQKRYFGGMNDKGVMEIECSNCGVKHKINIKNPLESDVEIGGTKINWAYKE